LYGLKLIKSIVLSSQEKQDIGSIILNNIV